MSQTQNYRDKLFAPRALDVETIILETIEKIQLAPLMIAELGDATKTNAVQQGLILNLDSLVKTVLTANRSTAFLEDYMKRRTSLLSSWPTGYANPPMEKVDELYRLTLEAIAKERLFKMRHHVAFAVGFLAGQQPDLEKMAAEEDLEEEERGEDES